MKSLGEDYLKNVGKYLYCLLSSQPIKAPPMIIVGTLLFCKSSAKAFEVFCKYLLIFNPALNCDNDKSYFKLIPF